MRRLEIISIDPHISALAKCVALRLFIRTNRASGKAYPSQALLARELSVSERSVRYALKELIDQGHIRVDHYRGRGCANLYELEMAADWQKGEAEMRLDADASNDKELPTKRPKRRKHVAEVAVENAEADCRDDGQVKEKNTAKGCRDDNGHPGSTLPTYPGNGLPTNPSIEPVDEFTDLYSIPGLLN